MTIDEAIKEVTFYEERLPLGVNDHYIDALKLLIEAGKRVKADRTLPYPVISDLLPGETEEKP